MFPDKHKYKNYLLFIIVISLFSTCSPKLSYDVKSFLFDGVTNPYEVEITVIKDSLLSIDSTLTNDIPISPVVRNEFNSHSPYKKRECTECHDRNDMDKPKLPLPELCNQCHEDFDKTYAVLHAPVASGECTECHSPHQSKLKNLLIKPSKELCLNCHTTTMDLPDKIHAKIDDTSCTECHNPHGGSNTFNLQSGSCYECHDNYEKKFEVLHAPVASENCSQCHGTHKSKTEKLLVNSKEDLCFNCHKSEDISGRNEHQSTEKNNCIECHDPHGSNKEMLLFN